MFERYSSQLGLDVMGEEGQRKLLNGRVLCVGAGGLGSVALYCLAGSGVGTLGIADGDTVSLSNLNRQFLHGMDVLGRPKTESAVRSLNRLNPELRYEAYDVLLNEENAPEIIQKYDLVLAAVDNLPTRMMLNRICKGAGVPLINGGVEGLAGMVQMVEFGKTACLACLYEDAPKKEIHPVAFPPVVSTISSLMAECAVFYLLTGKNPLGGDLMYYAAGALEFTKIHTDRNPRCPVCGAPRGTK